MANFEFLTFEQAAEILGVSLATLYRWLRLGTGPASYKVGKRRLFREHDLLRWLEAEIEDYERVLQAASGSDPIVEAVG